MPTGTEAPRERNVLSGPPSSPDGGPREQALNKRLLIGLVTPIKAQIQVKSWRPDTDVPKNRNARRQNRARGRFNPSGDSWDGKKQVEAWKLAKARTDGGPVMQRWGPLSSLVEADTEPAWPAWVLEVTGPLGICLRGTDRGRKSLLYFALCFPIYALEEVHQPHFWLTRPRRGCQTPFSSRAGSDVPGARAHPSESPLGKRLLKFRISNRIGLDRKLVSFKLTLLEAPTPVAPASSAKTEIKASGPAHRSRQNWVRIPLHSNNRSLSEATTVASLQYFKY